MTATPSFRKRYERDVLIEAEKASRIHELGKRFGFISPRVLRVDLANQVIVYERIDDLVTLQKHYIQSLRSRSASGDISGIFGEAGRILGILHRELTLSARHVWQPSPEWLTQRAPILRRMRSGPSAWLHCDYGFGNVFTCSPRATGQLVVLDSSPNLFLTTQAASFGPVYVDLASMTSCLQGLVPMKLFPFLNWGRERPLRESFIREYARASSHTIDLEILEQVTMAVAETYCRHRWKSHLMTRAAMFALYSRPNAAWGTITL